MSEMAPISPHRFRDRMATLGLIAALIGFGMIPYFGRSLTADGMAPAGASTYADIVNSISERFALRFRPPEEART